MASGSVENGGGVVPLGESNKRPEVEQPSGWDPDDTVPMRAVSESKEAAERAERLRLVSGWGRFGRRYRGPQGERASVGQLVAVLHRLRAQLARPAAR